MLTVNPEDLGRVIGKRGATAQSLRTLLRALGTKQEARFNLKIVDNGEPKPEREDRNGDAGSAWASTPSSSSDDSDTSTSSNNTDDEDTSNDDEKNASDDSGEEESRESAVERTRRELEDLDDLDV